MAESNLFESLDWLRSLQEASRVLSAANLEIVEKIRKAAKKMPHHPAVAEIEELIDSLVANHESSPSMATSVQEAVDYGFVPVEIPEGCACDDMARGQVVEVSFDDEQYLPVTTVAADASSVFLPAGLPASLKITDVIEANLPPMVKCDECGMKTPKNAKNGKCKHCGASIGPEDKPVQESVAESMLDGAGWLVEARKGGDGKRWAVVGIQSGKSINGRYWPAELLESPSFLAMSDGADVYADHDPPEERAKYPVRRVGDLIGGFEKPAPKRVGTDKAGRPIVEMHAEFVVIDPAWQAKLKAADEAGKLDSFTFSINALGETVRERRDGELVEAVQSVTAIRSYDLVTKASAGGRIDRMLEHAATQEAHMPDEPTVVLSQPVLDALTNAVARGFAAASAQTETPAPPPAEPDPEPVLEAEPDPEPAPVPEPAPAAVADPTEMPAAMSEAVARMERLTEQLERQAAEQLITTGLASSNLPGVLREAAEKRLRAISNRRGLTEADVTGIIAEYRPIAAAYLQESPLAEGRVTDMRSFHENYQNRIVAMLSTAVNTGLEPPKDASGTPFKGFTSLREAWWVWNQGSGNPFSADSGQAMMENLGAHRYNSSRNHSTIQESITTADWGQIVQDAMYLMMLRHYAFVGYDDWRKLFSTVEVAADFRTRHWARIGGYGDLPAVGEAAAYQPTTSPGDEEVTYSVTKRGMLEDSITLEMVANDQVGALARIPQELANSAKRTLYKFSFDLVTGQNPTMGYDSIALYHASHGSNTGTAALSVSALEAAAIAMEGQAARLAASETLGERNYPRFLITSRTGRARAQRILNPSDAYGYGLTPAATTPGANIDTDANIDPHHFKGSPIELLIYQYAATSGTYAWTNLRDWYLMADPSKVDTAIIGFFAGRQEPELFMQDDPNAGTGFSNDTHQLKVRHIYGGVAANHTSFRREVSSS